MTSDRRSGSRTNERRGRSSDGSRAPHEVRPGRRDGRPPTRVFPPLPTDPSTLPPLPAAFHQALDAGLHELRLDLPSGARRRIEDHVRLLIAWNSAINLTAITAAEELAMRHVVDSLTAIPLIRGASPSDGDVSIRLLDIGSGGGFPGVPLAAALPAARVSLVEATGKKARFLDAVVAATDLSARVDVLHGRAEDLAGNGEWDVVTARAVATLADLVELALPLLRVGGRLMAWKSTSLDPELVDGELVAVELAAGGRAATALGGGPPEVHPVDVAALAGHRLVTVVKVRETPGGYPRDPAARRARPW